MTSTVPGSNVIEAFIARQRTLLERERTAVIEQAHLLVSNCSPKVLEARGLALLSLGVASTSLGLGGKMCALSLQYVAIGILTTIVPRLSQAHRTGTTERVLNLAYTPSSHFQVSTCLLILLNTV